jgi:hypothetical protein
LRIAIARLNGSTNTVSAHTAGGTAAAPPSAAEKCAATPRFTIAERTPETHSDAIAGWRFSRAGGTE